MKKTLLYVVVIGIIIGNGYERERELIWSDEFDGGVLDSGKWILEFPGKHLDAINVMEAISIKDGELTITTYSEGGINYSGMISTRGIFENAYGYYEIRAKFGDSGGTWSDIWLYSYDVSKEDGDYKINGTEVDIVEHRVIDSNKKDISDYILHTLHWNGYGERHEVLSEANSVHDVSMGYHVYGLEWTPMEYRFYIDGVESWVTAAAVTSHPLFIILSTEVRDNFWAGDIARGGFGLRSDSVTKFTIDYVRVYESK